MTVRRSPRAVRLLCPALVVAAAMVVSSPVTAQQDAQGWSAGVNPAQESAPATAKDAAPKDRSVPAGMGGSGNTTVIERSPADGKTTAGANTGQVKLVALLTVDGQRIDQGIIWHVFPGKSEADKRSKPLSTRKEASPTIALPVGEYIVVASFGRAYQRRKITVKPGEVSTEQIVLNAGGVRLNAQVGAHAAPSAGITYAIYSDERRDQYGNREAVMTGAKPGLIIRLNAGIYHLVSRYGDANAVVEADVTVEAGKLTEATVSHAAAKVTLKLVNRGGGEAMADTQWSVQTPQGEVVKEMVGALPTHLFAPGTYTAIAKSGGRTFRRDFTVKDGDTVQIEVLMQ